MTSYIQAGARLPFAVTVALVGVSAVIAYAGYNLLFHPLRKVPGPFLARSSGIWRAYRYFRQTWHDDILNVHRRYGPVVRIAPNEVSIVDEGVLKTVYSHSKGACKSGWYDTWTQNDQVPGKQESLFSTRNPKAHGLYRRRVSAMYSLSSIIQYEPQVQKVADALWQHFDRFAETQEAFDLHQWASYFTFDVNSTLAQGHPAGYVESGSDVQGFMEGVQGTFYWAANLGVFPLQNNLLANPITSFFISFFDGNIQKYAGSFMKVIGDMMESHIKRQEEEKQGRNMLDTLCQQKAPDGNAYPPIDTIFELGNVLTAGDTTSVGIRAVLGPLLQDPARYKRLQDELDAAFRSHMAETGDVSSIALPYRITKDLLFLTACIREGTRLHPSISYQLPRDVPAEGAVVADYVIPGGSIISLSAMAQNRNKDVFGEDADEYRPERWMVSEGADEAYVKRIDRYDATFGYGSRTCIGKNLAIFEIYKFTSQFLRRYDAELTNPEKPWRLETAWICFQKDMFVSVKRREGVA